MLELEGIRQKVFIDRYSLKDASGQPIESSPEQMWRRVARGIASVEQTNEKRVAWEHQFYDTLSNFQFVPGGRILAGAGSGHQVTAYNCFVAPSPEDSRGGILDNLKIVVEMMSRGGGVGINFSTLRPRGSYVRTVNGTASGPCSWMQLYSVATGDVVIQGGTRRGAAMHMLDDTHPDIEEFVTVKKTSGMIEHANLSICISNALMQAVKDDTDWHLTWQGEVRKTLRARALWDLICQSAWESAEPGLVFMDRVNEESNTWYYQDIRCTNPCGEEPLEPYGVCNLGALNLSSFVENGTIDFDRLAHIAKVAMRFLDNVIDVNEYFIPENKKTQMDTRRTGLGTMGLADALIKMQIPYGSEASLSVIERIYSTIRDAAYEASIDLAHEKGAFPQFNAEKYLQGRFIQRLPSVIRDMIGECGIRNAVILTQAPTGTTSLLAGVSSGIEPVYDFAMIRRDRTGEHTLYHPLFEEWINSHPNEIAPEYFVCSKDLSPEEHIRVQAAIQRYTDASISKTVNAPEFHTVEQVQKLYMLAYDSGCKGVTYYRDGSRDAVLTRVSDEQKTPPHVMEMIATRPDVVQGYTRQIEAPEGKVNLTLNSSDDGLFEVFINVGKAGSDIAALSEALGRLISLVLQLDSAHSSANRTHEIIRQLRNIGGSGFVGFGSGRVRSLPDAVARALELHIESLGKPYFTAVLPLTGNLCPECGCNTVVCEEGCKKCYSCGHSEC